MDDQDNRVSLKIDLSTGTIELVAPAESFNEAMEKTKELAATLDLQGKSASHASTERTAVPPPASVEPIQSPSRARGRASKSGARAGRIGSYEPIPDFLTEAQEIELRALMAEKSPTEQADRVLVAMVKAEELLGRKGLIYNEIYTAMWLAGIKDLPKALDVVLGNLIQNQFVIRDGAGFSVKFLGRNRVASDLPRRDGG